MSTLTDIEYWQSRGWGPISKATKALADEYEKCRQAYTKGVREGLINPDDPTLSFYFTQKFTKRGVYGINEIERAAAAIGLDTDQITELTEALRTRTPDNEAYFIKFR